MHVDGMYFETNEDAARYYLGDEMTDQMIANGELVTAPDPGTEDRLVTEQRQLDQEDEIDQMLGADLRKVETAKAVAAAVAAGRAYGCLPLLEDENAGLDVAVDIEIWGLN